MLDYQFFAKVCQFAQYFEKLGDEQADF